MKTCKKCNIEKNEESFPIKGKNPKTGGRIYESVCKLCVHIEKLPYTVTLPPDTKVCNSCNNIKSKKDFRMYKAKCIECYNKDRRESYIHKEKSEFKTCSNCCIEKHVDDFRNRRLVSGTISKHFLCKVCENKERGDRAKLKNLTVVKDATYYANLERVKSLRKNYTRQYRAKKYGITEADLDRMELEQDNKCYLCDKDAIESSFGTLVIDHSHNTGKVRKLLCSACNALLGAAKDSPEFLRKCANYIEDFS